MPKVPSRIQVELAPRNGATILRTKATEVYRLGASDLDSILPVSTRPHGKNLRMEYNVVDVVTLDTRLNSNLPGPLERAVENGPQIHYYAAMKQFKLRPAQLHRIKPVSEIPTSGKPLGMYNCCDVEALAASVNAAAASPSRPVSTSASSSVVPESSADPGPSVPRTTRAATRKRAPRRPRIRIEEDYNYEDDFNMFDGMSPDDAKALLHDSTLTSSTNPDWDR
ncbi:hypothetical protein C8R44DRAFT_893034 [Mycena epipterygia]|nr:hypothetical protein C8R44DRAFT_893034 [Mycena epipterygia]